MSPRSRTSAPQLAGLLVWLAAAGAGPAWGQDGAPSPGESPVEHTNRLAQEQSPYLLQHAHNPVDWYPWGEEAFARAKAEDKPIFLSIGYATCHWCHVMERESFENEQVAAFLNAHFVAIKVDREERPDVDEIYMGAVQAMTGSGGWPLSVFLTPEGKPFFGGTYFPMPGKYGRPSFLDLLGRVQAVWTSERAALEKDAQQLAAHLRTETAPVEGELGSDLLETGYQQLAGRFDHVHGGFGDQTKFPTPHNLTFLLRYYARTGEQAALEMVTRTLDAMADGGLRDHLGGGFHRYSVDPAWRIPHFEKMLYDQAGLVRAYAEAWQVTGQERYAAVVRQTLAFVLRDMRDPGGAFTSAWDADSEGEEGKYYVWTPAELRALLGDHAPAFMARYGVTAKGNFPEIPGATHLRLAASLEDVAGQAGLSVAALQQQLAADRALLLEARGKRVPPLHDDKVLTDWNGLMIGACAEAGRILGEPEYLAAASGAAEFVLAELQRDGQLLHRYRAGHAGIPAMLDDYAFLAQGLLELFEATQEVRWLHEARRLTAAMLEGFWDDAAGGFFLSRDPGLIDRSKPTYDGAIPAGNAVAAALLLRLGHLLQDETRVERGAQTLRAYGGSLKRAPGLAYACALQAVDLLAGPCREVVLAGDPADPALQALRAEVERRFLPRTTLIVRPSAGAEALLAELPFLKAQVAQDGAATAYVCQGYACQAPVHEVAELARQLDAHPGTPAH